MTAEPQRLRHFRGYPAHYRGILFSQIGCSIGCLPIVASPLYAAAFYWNQLHGHLRTGTVVALLLSGLLFLMFVALLAQCFPRPQILPYFEKRLGDAGTWLHGQALARNCRALDEAAMAHGVTPLSAFGYGDELAREAFTWHDAARGLEAVRGLEELIPRFRELVDDTGAVWDELQLMEDALAKAAERGVRFCLHMRCSDYTSGVEMDARRGSYF
ncbi:MAG: hypothetical protein FD180_2766 [Planctomycetota bacterium]|nr:MAG: hypothetical protein FD180_2766 [Planctomycetota bacterium]